MADYSKGEWKVEQTSLGELYIVNTHRWLAKVYPITDHQLEEEANAHLISAAPLMAGQLETGKEALQEALNLINAFRPKEAKGYIKGVITGNELALAKADGK